MHLVVANGNCELASNYLFFKNYIFPPLLSFNTVVAVIKTSAGRRDETRIDLSELCGLAVAILFSIVSSLPFHIFLA